MALDVARAMAIPKGRAKPRAKGIAIAATAFPNHFSAPTFSFKYMHIRYIYIYIYIYQP